MSWWMQPFIEWGTKLECDTYLCQFINEILTKKIRYINEETIQFEVISSVII